MFRSYLRHFGYIAPQVHIQPRACRIPDRAVRGDRAAGAEPGPAQTSYNLYDAYRAATARPCARPTRAGPIVLACERVRTQVAHNTEAVLYLRLLTPALYTVKVRINNNCLLQGMPTRHRYKSCVWSMLYALRMHYVFRVPCSGVGAVWGVASHPSATHAVYFCACA